jgi:hypothetical protein
VSLIELWQEVPILYVFLFDKRELCLENGRLETLAIYHGNDGVETVLKFYHEKP